MYTTNAESAEHWMTYSRLAVETEKLWKIAKAMEKSASRDLGKLASDVEESFAHDPDFRELQEKYRAQSRVVNSLHCF
jgi:hypothetical protein